MKEVINNMLYTREHLIAFWSDKGTNGIYSQWYTAPFKINAKSYFCNEQYMMWSKAMLFGDTEVADKIMESISPREIKALGRQVKNFDQAVWDQHKERIVYDANYAKFTQNRKLKKALIDTEGKLIVEASPYDRIWGVGLYESDDRILDTCKWPGKNLLGNAIMQVRYDLKNGR